MWHQAENFSFFWHIGNELHLMVFSLRRDVNGKGIAYAAAHTLVGNITFWVEVDADFGFICRFFARSCVVHLQVECRSGPQ